MGSWRKLLRPGPVDLGTRHLDEITEPGLYTQPYVARATKERGYPFPQAGILEVKPWRSDGVIAEYTASEGAIATRSWVGVWRSWRDALGREVA